MSAIANLEREQVELFRPVVRGEPTWNIALLFPAQGEWTEEDYLALQTTRMIELSEGCLEVLPMPTFYHQRIVRFLFELLEVWILQRSLGEVFFAPASVRLWAGKLREPDVIFLRPGRLYNPKRPSAGADLVIEVVSEGEENRERDLEFKRDEYAKAGIAEYWMVDPEEQRITVLTLDGTTYRVHGEFTPGTRASSVLLPGFVVDVAATLAAGDGPPTAPQA